MSKKTVLRYKTIVISDVHLGTVDCKIEEVNHFLKRTESDTLILNGDIIDGWKLLRSGGWSQECTRFARLVLKKAEKRNTQVIYTRGNHDDVLGRVLPLELANFSICEEHVHEAANGKRYLVVHGDVFDVVTQNHRFLAVIGAFGYYGLLHMNRWYNRYRRWRGKEYFSLSQHIKAKVKEAVNHISRFEEHLQKLASSRDCEGIICGHIHTPANKQVGEIHYLNSGDWVESLTALVEHEDGQFEILTYADFVERLRRAEAEEAIERGDAVAFRKPQIEIAANPA